MSKRKSIKSSSISNTVVEDVPVEGVMYMSVNTIQSMLFTEGRFLSAMNRPAHSRLVNFNCLRPHGAVHESERVPCETSAPPPSVLDEVAALVNGSRRLLHRSADFVCTLEIGESLAVLHRTAFRCWWLDSIARACESAAAYPWTSFHFMAPTPPYEANGDVCSSEASSSLSVDPTAEIIRRILLVFACGSNESRKEWQELLFHSLCSEQGAGLGLIATNYNSRHITVCCGLYFYSVEVLSPDGVVISSGALTERLQAVREHAVSAERALREQSILPEAREDLVGFHKLLGRLTQLDRATCAALMHRLSRASAVNAASLAAMDAGIFSVALRGADGRACDGRWHRCALQLEERAAAGELTLRAHAALVHRDDLLAFLERALSGGGEGGGGGKGGSGGGKGGSGGEAQQWDAPRGGGFAPLEVWLPWKHRRPIQPYAPAAFAPRATPIALPSRHGTGNAASVCAKADGAGSGDGCVSFARLCLATVLAVQREIAPRGSASPAVVVAFPHAHGAVSAALLCSAEVVAFIQACRCESALVEKWAMKELAVKALGSIAEIVNACYSAPFPLYALATLLLERGHAVSGNTKGVFGEIDLCISSGVLGTNERVLSCNANVAMPARFAVDCGVAGPLPVQDASMAKRPADAHVAVATLSSLCCTDDEATSKGLVDSILDEYETLTRLLSM